MELQPLVHDKNGHGKDSPEHNGNIIQLSKGNNDVTQRRSVTECENNDNSIKIVENIKQDKITKCVGFMHFLRVFLAPGVLTMSYTMSLIGIWSGTIGALLMGFLSTFNILTIIRCAQYLCKRFNVQSLDYADVFGYSVSIGPKFSRNFDKETKTIVAATVSAATIGYCIVYVSMAASYMQQLIQMHVDDHFNLRPSVLVFCVMLIPISLTTTLTLLAPFSTLGNVVNIINLAAILEYVCRDLPNIDSRPWFHSETEQPGLLLIAISNLMFSFEGIGSVLPIENRLIDKESYGGWNGLACLGMTIVVSMYTGFGFFGLLKFGEKTQPSLLLNLPSTGTLYTVIKVLNIFVLYTSVGFQMFVPSKIIWHAVEKRITSDRLIKYGEYILRLTIWLFITLFSIAVPNTDLVQPLVGAMCGSTLAFVFPPLMMVFILWHPSDEEEHSMFKCFKRKIRVIFYLLLFILGFSVTVCCTVAAIQRIIYQ